jgi:hypothetical protein
VLACGEVASVLREGGRKVKCTCGNAAKDCQVWGPLQADPARLAGLSHAQLALALVAAAPRPDAVVVDSSKTPWRSILVPFRLARALGENFLLVHLVRDPRAVSWSAVKKSGRQGTRPLMALRTSFAAFGWWIANLACEAFGKIHPGSYTRVSYEDLASDPEAVMRGLAKRITPGASWRGETIGAYHNRHQLYGNRMRSKSLSLAEIKEDAAWKSEMPEAYRSLVGTLTLPLRKRYGYR